MPQKSRGGNQGKQKENYCSGENNEREQDKKRWTRILTSEKYRFCASLANKVDTMGSGEDGGSCNVIHSSLSSRQRPGFAHTYTNIAMTLQTIFYCHELL